MSAKYLLLYGFAALVIIFSLVRTCLERERIGKKVSILLIFGLVCTVAYSVNFMTDEYEVMSIATSVMMMAQDFMLVAMFVYALDFTRIKNKVSSGVVIVATVFAALDSIVFMINAFREIALQYSMNMVENFYVLGYEGNVWFTVHTMMSCAIAGLIIGTFVIKCMRIPAVYWKRYTMMIAGLLCIILVKYLFISKVFDLRFDISILLYALMGLLIYWNTFWYSKKTMLNTTHTMIIDHMQVPVILFDYENVLADFNEPMSKLFTQLELDNREQTYEWFCDTFSMPQPEGADQHFTWEIGEQNYDCHVVNLMDHGERNIGKIVVMQDVTALKRAYVELEQSITHDRLTGLYNRNSFIQKCVEFTNPDTWPVSIVVCDINDLTKINIVYGRKQGDRLMVAVSDIIRDELDGKAYVARLDDGNISAAFANTTKETAAAYFDRIGERITKECSMGDFLVTVEYGIGVKEDDSISVIKTERIATEAMKEKKNRKKVYGI